MKLHLPHALFRRLLAAACTAVVFTCAPTAEASHLHADVSQLTYTDFGQNRGRYAVGNTNALLKHLNSGGVTISYEGGQADYTLEHGMVDFSGVIDTGGAGAIGYNFVASAYHVATTSPTFSADTIGKENAIQYKGIEYATSDTFLLYTGGESSHDYKITRLNKIVTDVDGATVYTGDTSALQGELLYRAGTGIMQKADHEGNLTYLSDGGYATGGIDTIDGVNTGYANTPDGSFQLGLNFTPGSEGINDSEPLPFKGNQGDSGSPGYVWNEQSGQYEYVAAASKTGGNWTGYRGNTEWTIATMNSFNQVATIGADNTLYLGAIDQAGETITDGSVSTTLYSGNATNASGDILATYKGVQSGTNTWKKLNNYKDTQNWYSYDNSELNASYSAGGTGVAQFDLSYADLFYNDNLIIRNSSTADQTIVLNATVDLGIGYVQFSKGEGLASANYIVQSAGDGDYLLNSAGFVVDEGVSVHMQLTNPADYMREWRKVGEGDLYIEGSGNNDIFLNVGGNGTTYLQRGVEFGVNWDGNYAAYNVLVNNGATVVINDTDQIKRDLTFGNGGGVLDINGNSMTWNNDNGAEAAGFTIHALDEQAIITSSTTGKMGTVLTWTQSGDQSWLGSFVDTATGELTFKYDGGAGSRLTMHSIHTDLSNNANSGMEVASGTLALQGTNTVHGLGSLNGIETTRYENADDWHYADATSNVTVNNGGTFELGSHARLTGDVTVYSGGTFVMREGVKHQMEYIEGGQELENTDDIRAFFGLKGNVALASGSAMKVQFSEGTDSTLEYAHQISGAGSLSVEAGTDGGILHLSGDNSGHTGSKAVVSGGLHAASDAALGDTSSNKWLIGEKGWLASDSFTTADTILEHIDSASTGVLALTTDIADEISLTNHQGLIIGAMEGCEVEYGTADKSLSAVDGKWTLGGGGGTLIVNFLLEGNNELVLGNEYGKGSVHLTNSGNNISSITFAGGVKLSYENGALDNVGISLGYGSSLEMLNASHLTSIARGAEGAMLVDNVATTDVDLSEHQKLSLSAAGDCRYTGNITLAEGADYHFGGSTGSLTVATALEAGHNLVIDGQGWTGGSVVLENASAVNGDVTVRGYDAARTSQTVGTATLRLAENNGLANAASVTVENGGSIELNGTAQAFQKLTLGSTGSILDSSADRSGTLELTGETVLNGTLNVASVTKTGEGNVTLGGSNNATRFEVQGTGDNVVTLTSAAATHSQGTLAVSNATLDLNDQTATQGTIELGEGAQLINMGDTPIQTLHVVGNSTGDYRNAAGGTTSYGKINITTLNVDAGSQFELNGAVQYNMNTDLTTLTGAGDVVINLNKPYNGITGNEYSLTIRGTNTNFSGNLTIASDCSAGTFISNYTSLGKGTATLDGTRLKVQTVNTASTAIQATINVGTKGVVVNTDNLYFTGLSGTGRIEGVGMSFRGDLTGFSGTIYGKGSNATTTFGGSGLNYHSITGNSSAGAINLFGNSATLYSASSSTSAYQFQYTDDVILNASVSGGAGVTQAGTGTLVLNQANTATGALTINEGGTVELAAGGSWAGSLAGSGTLVNNSTSVTFSNADSFTGSLSLAEGSSLAFGTSSYSLNSGESLGVFAVDGVTAGATLNLGTLTLNGGELSFSGEALVDGNNAALITNATVSAGSALSGQTISLSDTSALSAGSYLLASGDWSSLQGTNFTVNGVAGYLTGSVTATSSGLMLNISQAEGVQVWNGTGGQSSWTADTFGTNAAGSGNAYFTDAAASKEVSISGAVSAEALVFTAKEDYVLTPESGATLSASSLELQNSGKVTLGSGVTISGTTTLAEGSEVVVKDFNTLGGAVSGHGTLTIDAGAASGSESLSGLKNLQLLSGRYDVSGQIGADTVEVKGGQLYIQAGGTYTASVSLSGNGWTDSTDNFANAALRLHSSGKQVVTLNTTLESDVTVAATGSGEKQLAGTWDGQGHVITKEGGNILWMTEGNHLQNIGFVAAQGELRLGGSVNTALSSSIHSLTVKNGAELSFCAATSTLNASLTLESNSTLDLTSTGNNNLQTYTITGDVELKYTSSGTREVLLTSTGNRTLVLDGEVSGDARFAFRGHLPTTTLTLTLNNEHNTFTQGIVVGANRTNAVINLAAAGSAGTGAIELGNATALLNVAGNAEGYGQMVNTISGEGKLQVTTGNLELTGQNSYSGGTTVGNGASLKLAHASAAGTGAIALSDAESELVYAGSETAEHSTLANAVSGAGRLKVDSGKVALAADSSVGAATVAQGASLKLSGAAVLAVADSVTIGNKATPSAATAFSLASAEAVAEEATLENVAMTGSSLTGAAEGAQGVVSEAALNINAATFAMADLALVSSDVQLQAGELSLSDVVLAGSHISGLSAESTQVNLQQEVTLALSNEAYTLVDGALYGEAYAGKTVAVYTIETFSNVSLSGNMLMDISSVAAITSETEGGLSTPDFYAFDFGDRNVDTGRLTLSANIGGSVTEGVQAGESSYLFNASANGDAVPEPTSATLALLGLTGLAMRRRRK